jgi:hypothetical protein
MIQKDTRAIFPWRFQDKLITRSLKQHFSSDDEKDKDPFRVPHFI